jgi:AGCS family alanine or glycine:cation symporter
VFSTILGWSYYGEKAIEYLLGKKAILPYRILWIVLVFLGSVFSLSLVWDLADLFNGLMAIPNLISLLLLSPVIVSETKKYLWSNNLEEIDKTPNQTIERK